MKRFIISKLQALLAFAFISLLSLQSAQASGLVCSKILEGPAVAYLRYYIAKTVLHEYDVKNWEEYELLREHMGYAELLPPDPISYYPYLRQAEDPEKKLFRYNIISEKLEWTPDELEFFRQNGFGQ